MPKKDEEPEKERFPCLVCKKDVQETDEGLECHDCLVWAHRQCTDITPHQYSFLSDDASHSMAIQWVCDKCLVNKGDKKVIQSQLQDLKDCVVKLSQKIVDMEKTFAGSLEEKVSQIMDKKVHNLKETVLDEVMDEIGEKEKRKLNLIVVNLPESRETDRC